MPVQGDKVHVHVCMYICWLLLSNENFKGPYLKAEVVEEIMGRLGLVGLRQPTKQLHNPN